MATPRQLISTPPMRLNTHQSSTIRCKIPLEDQLDIPVDLIVKSFGYQSSIAVIAKTEGIFL